MVEMILAWKMMVFHVTQRRQTPAIYAPRKSLTTMAAVAMSLSLSRSLWSHQRMAFFSLLYS